MTAACNAKKLEIQRVLEFFGQETVARVVRDSPKLHDPSAAPSSTSRSQASEKGYHMAERFLPAPRQPLAGLPLDLDLRRREGASRDRLRERDQLDGREVLEAEVGHGGHHPAPRGHRRARQEDKQGAGADRAELNAAVETNQDDLAVVLIQKKNPLDDGHGRAEGRPRHGQKDADSAKTSLLSVQAEIRKLKAERDSCSRGCSRPRRG